MAGVVLSCCDRVAGLVDSLGKGTGVGCSVLVVVVVEGCGVLFAFGFGFSALGNASCGRWSC